MHDAPAGGRLQLYLVRARPGTRRRCTRLGGHHAARSRHSHRPASTSPATAATSTWSTSARSPRIHIAVPAPRWRQGQAHAPPWPGLECTAHQLANAICSCTWCAPGQVVRGADALASWPPCSTPTAIVPASAARASSTWPTATSPATAATLPIDVGTAFQDPYCRAGVATAHGGAHARPWPGPEHTAHLLAATTGSCTW